MDIHKSKSMWTTQNEPDGFEEEDTTLEGGKGKFWEGEIVRKGGYDQNALYKSLKK